MTTRRSAPSAGPATDPPAPPRAGLAPLATLRCRRGRRRSNVLIRTGAIAAVAVLLAAGCGRLTDRTTDLPPGEAIVDHPVDGDTVVVRIGGGTEPVRLIGIDTPESVARERPVECFGPEAKRRTAELLPAGTRVRLERDIEARDQYGRLLAYVHRVEDGTFANLLLVQEGYAEAFPYRPNTAHQADFDRAEAEARAGQRGLWPVCGGTDVPVGPAAG